MNITNIPKFVVNLERRPDRLEHIQKEMDYMGWEYELFKAVDLNNHGGCTLSHTEIIKIAKERGLIYDIDSINSDVYKSLVEFTFSPFKEEDKEKLFMLKLQLFELEPIKNSSDRAAKAAMRKAPDIITAFKHAIDIFLAQSTEETST